MATTSCHVTMLREISAAGDRERTGALDIEWEGAHATLFFMFGHPSHLVFETADGRTLDGEPALNAILDELPTEFRVAPWRRAMVTDDTLHCSAEDLMGLFQRRHAVPDTNGQTTDPAPPAVAPVAETFAPAAVPGSQPPEPALATGRLPFGLSDFPLLPLATALWTDAAANVVNLEAAVPRLPDSLLVLSGPTCKGAALIAGGMVTDAVWVNASTGQLGDQAAHSLMTSLEGTLTAYRIEDLRLVSALPMLWRSPRLGSGLPAGWLHTDDVVAEVRTSGRSCGLLVESADPGVGLFEAGELVAVYTASQQWPATSMAALRSLLHASDACVSVIGDVAGHSSAPDTAEVQAPESAAPVAQATDAHAASAEEITILPTGYTSAALVDEPGAAVGQSADTEPVAADAETAALEPMADAAAAPTRGRGRGRRRKGKGNGKAGARVDDVASPATTAAADAAAVEVTDFAVVEPATNGAEPHVDESADTSPEAATEAEAAPEVETATGPDTETASAPQADAPPVFEVLETEAPAPDPSVADLHFEPAVFTIADLSESSTAEPNGMAGVEAREATEFVPARLDIDVDALRAELTDIATVWLGEDDAAPVAKAISAARPGVDDFVSTIAAISTMEVPGHESAVVRAMAREMHYRATEVLTGV
ncbi:MAG: hypothetical protein JF886_01250 [Candidatus Dormibacteraeota bacterium]|uniref:DUF4388 domain-containing protein n=1 Tax=Candidatus Aeolococcus gillhamiae TaxID=3127015 RepID=A0A934N2C1_9BACT|nr:hypothetical protein [Candidatus Dormibacteraeota bacterium]